MGQLHSLYPFLHPSPLHKPFVCENGPLELCHYPKPQPCQSFSTIVPWLLWLNSATLVQVLIMIVSSSSSKSLKYCDIELNAYIALICMLKSTRSRIIGMEFITGNEEVVYCCSTSICSPRPFNGKSKTGLVKVLPTCFTLSGRYISIFTSPFTFGLTVSGTWLQRLSWYDFRRRPWITRGRTANFILPRLRTGQNLLRHILCW